MFEYQLQLGKWRTMQTNIIANNIGVSQKFCNILIERAS